MRQPIFATVLTAALVLTITSCFDSAAKPTATPEDRVPVHVAYAKLETVPLEVAAIGTVEAVRSVDIRARVAGVVEEVAFKEGQSVSRGQLLFRIDGSALQREAAERRADIEHDLALEEQTRAVLDRDRASQRQSQLEADHAVSLAKDGILANERTEQLVTADETAQAALHADQAAINAAAGTLKADQARLAETELQLAFTSITSPLAGRAGAISVRAGTLLRESDAALVTIRQLSPINVSFGIAEQDLLDVRHRNAAGPLSIEASSGDNHFLGHLTFIDDAVDTATGNVRLKGEFPNPDELLWPGEFLPVRLRLRSEPHQLVVPESSVKEGQRGTYVWRVRSGMAGIVPVKVARTYKPPTGPELAVLASGMEAGDAVVTEGQIRLTPGARVTQLPDATTTSIP